MKKILTLIVLLIPVFMFAEKTTIGYFGILSEPLDEAMKSALDIEDGVLITKVYEDTPADKAGFMIGDVIYEIDGEKIEDMKTLKQVIADRPDKKVTIKFLRSSKHMKESLTLGEKEKDLLKFNLEIPDIEEFKAALKMGKEEFQNEIEALEKEIEVLKQEIEDIKRQIQEK